MSARTRDEFMPSLLTEQNFTSADQQVAEQLRRALGQKIPKKRKPRKEVPRK